MNTAQSMTRNQEVTVQQNSLQAALVRASNDAAAKVDKAAPTTQSVSKDLQAVIGRVTVLGEQLLFIVDTHTKNADGTERIKYWTQGSNHLRDAPIEFYKQSRPLDQESAQKLVGSYGKAMKVQHLLVRQRLVKEQVAKRDEDGSISLEAQNEWKATMKAKFKAAFDRAVDDAFAAM